jgi:hypothetical protein
MSVKITGFDDLTKNLKNLQNKLGQLEGTNKVLFGEIFSASFMSRHTKFSSIDTMFEAGGFKVDSEADFEKIPEVELDAFVESTTSFSSWKDMQEKASQEWVTKKLGL